MRGERNSRLRIPHFLRVFYDAPPRLLSRASLSPFTIARSGVWSLPRERAHSYVYVYVQSRIYIFFPLFLRILRQSDPSSGSATPGISSGRLRENYRGVILDEIVPTEKKRRRGCRRYADRSVDAPRPPISPVFQPATYPVQSGLIANRWIVCHSQFTSL